MEQRVHDNGFQPTVALNLPAPLSDLRIEIDRMVADLRVKTKGASAEARHTLEALDIEAKRFADELTAATEETCDDLRKVGMDLRMRIQKLANQVALLS